MLKFVEGSAPENWQSIKLRNPAESKTAMIFFIVAAAMFCTFAGIGLAVFINTQKAIPFLVLICLGVVMALPFLFLGLKVRRATHTVNQHGVPATGIVKYKWIFRVGSRYSVIQHTVGIEFSHFRLGSLQVYQVHPAWYKNLSVGDNIEIVYNPDDPNNFRIIGKV
ncbi:MAG: hypothetical protein KDK41_05660 [Leptospiraceae bacterium]|nr:hypothetical protein [Leptospiraceae bacterium]